MAEKDSYGTVQTDIFRRRSSLEVYRTFLGEFNSAIGAKLIIFLGFLTAVGIGGLVGVVPQVVTQRFAELNYDLEDGIHCDEMSGAQPDACLQGSEYAQGAASYSVLARNLLAILTNSLAGSYTDVHGRRGKSYEGCTIFNFEE